MPYAAYHPDCEVLHKPRAEDLEQLAVATRFPAVMVFGWGFETLRELAPLEGRLQTLKISGAPRLQSLDGIQRLPTLREFVLTTPTGSSGSGRLIAVDSLAPLESLGQLERLVIQGVRPRDLDLSPIMRMTHLRELEIGGAPEFVLEHYARLSVALPDTVGRCLRPYVTIEGVGRCRKCNGQCVLLVGAPPRSRKFVCPACSPMLLAAHVGRWEQTTGRPYRAG